MSIASELEAFTTHHGSKCRIATGLHADHPAQHADLMEAIASSAQHNAVARWWNATRAEATGLRITGETVARHRMKECVGCR